MTQLFPYQIGAIMQLLPRSSVDSAFAVELDIARAKAASAGFSERFEIAWAYEKERARESAGNANGPIRVLSILLRLE